MILRNARATDSVRATDKDGMPRPQGKAFDLGAYEAPR
jgi:hypothetical protein